MATRIRKTPYRAVFVDKEYEILCSIYKENASDIPPKTPEEHFALFLLKWLKIRFTPDVLKNTFEYLMKSRPFYTYTDNYDESKYNIKSVILKLQGEFIYMICLKAFDKELFRSFRDLLGLLHYGKSELSKEDYENLLFLEYCYSFSYECQFDDQTERSLLAGVRTLKIAIKGSRLFKQAQSEVNPRMKLTTEQEEYFRTHYHTLNMQSKSNFERLASFFYDFFQVCDSTLTYSQWKATIPSIDDFDDRLLHSLFVRFHKCLGTECEQKFFYINYHPDVTIKQQVVSMLYYWYYGLFEGRYADLIFDILHNSYMPNEKKLLNRLVATEKDENVQKYLQEKYLLYCEKKHIPDLDQIKPLKKPSQTLTNNKEVEDDRILCQLEKPEGFDDRKLDTLVGLLQSKLNLISVKDKISLAYFLGKENPKPCSNYIIEWNKSRHSLKYFIVRLYSDKIKDGTWYAVWKVFRVTNNTKKVQLTNSMSYSNLSMDVCENNIEETLMNGIIECISQAKNTTNSNS